MIQKKRSLMFRLMMAINAAVLIVLIAMTSFILDKTSNEVAYEIDHEIKILLGFVKFTTAEYVKTANNTNLESIANHMVSDPLINEVIFYDKDNKVLASAKNKDPEVEKLTEKIFEKKSEVIKLGEEAAGAVGYVTIKYNYNKLILIKNDFYLIGAISILLSQILLVLVMWYALSKSIKALNLTTDKLQVITLATSESAKEVENISQEVSSSSNEQAASIQETVATLDQITSQVSTTADSVTNSTKKSEESLQSATEGKAVVTEMIKSMEAIGLSNKDIMDEIARGNERIGGIVKIINEISQKTAVINDIVFQTKLLSFNASVEAARAGEHGKGFAVVAEEVGKLAQMSGKASTEIADILSDSIAKVNGVIEETNRNVKQLTEVGSKKVDGGMKVAERCGEVLEDIVTNAAVIKNMLNEISVASKEQAEGVRNIAAAMNQLDQATLSNNKAANASAENAGKLSEHSTSLQLAVTELQTVIHGGVHAASESAKPKAKKEVSKEVVKKVIIEDVAPIPEKKEKEKNNVIAMTPKKEAPKTVEIKAKVKTESKIKSEPVPTVSASTKTKNQNALPTYDDPRFEDV